MAGLLALGLAAPAGRPAHAFCRSVVCPPGSPDRCLNPATGCPEGTPLAWRSPCVGFSFQRDFSRHYPHAELRAAVERAFFAWVGVECPGGGQASVTFSALDDVSCRRQEFNAAGPNANAVIFRDTDFQYTDVDNTIAKTTVTYDINTGEIKDADIEINTTYNEFSLDDSPERLYDLQAVIAHEAGHFLGIAHTQGFEHPDATMFERYEVGQTHQRDLSPDDVAALCAAYPPGRAVERCDPVPRGGLAEACGSDESAKGCSLAAPPPPFAPPGAPLLTAAAAALALRARRARRPCRHAAPPRPEPRLSPMRRPLLALCLAPLLAALAGSCAEGEPRVGTSCTPNQRTFCRCPDGEGGTQLCAADGRSFGECGPCGGVGPGGDDDDDVPITGGRPVCGNQIVEPGEQCDDGNTDEGDECSSLCQRARPGGPAPGEAADGCDGAAPASLNVGVEFQSRQGLAAASADLLGSCGGDAAELVFGLTPTISGRLELSLRPDDPALDLVLYVRQGACADAASEPAGGCQNAAAAGGEEALALPVEAGTSYYVFADAQGALAGAAPFTLTARVNPIEACQGEGTACQTGLQGACADGTLRCVEGQFLVCRSDQSSAQEICGDGLDNDCDGDTDEGCPCAHDKCATGGQLAPSCTSDGAVDPCVQAICDADPFCCDPVAEPDGEWDLACVKDVYFVCGSLSCDAHAGGCAHSVCEEGGALQAGCDGNIGCVNKVCAATQDPFCCNAAAGEWDEFCVAKANELCSLDGQPDACSP